MLAKSSPKRRKRSRSGAHCVCPHCGKKLRGEKGLIMHIREEHKDSYLAVIAANPDRKLTADDFRTGVV